MKKIEKNTLMLLASFTLLSACAGRTVSSNPSASSSGLSSPLASYLIKFVNEDGTLLQSSSYQSGSLPVYEGETPTKAMTSSTYYVFSGWTPQVVVARADVTYTATFTAHDIAAESLKKLSFVYDSASTSYQIEPGEDAADLPAVIVPSTHDDGTNGSHPVSALLDNAFWNWDKLEQVSLPTSLTKIGASAFANDTLIKELTIPEGVTEIDLYAFQACLSLTKIFLPSTLSQTGIALFYGDAALTTINVASGNSKFTSDTRSLIKNGTTLVAYASGSGSEYIVPDGVSAIDVLAFNDSEILETLTFPASLTSMDAVTACPALKKFVLKEGNSVFTTDSRAMINQANHAVCAYANASGSDYTIPDGVTKIGMLAFSEATSLVSITAPSSLTEIELDAFEGCSSLKDTSFPDTLKSLGSGTFIGCVALTSIVIPSALTKIQSGCFIDCRKLNNVTLPAGITTIEQNAFNSAESLGTLHYAGTMSEWAKISKGSSWHDATPLKSVICSDGTTTALD